MARGVYLSRQPSYSVPEVSSQNFVGTSVQMVCFRHAVYLLLKFVE